MPEETNSCNDRRKDHVANPVSTIQRRLNKRAGTGGGKVKVAFANHMCIVRVQDETLHGCEEALLTGRAGPWREHPLHSSEPWSTVVWRNKTKRRDIHNDLREDDLAFRATVRE